MRCVQRRACPRPLHLNLFPTSTPPLINYENGKTAYIQSLPAETVGWGSTEFVVMRSVPPTPPEYTYLLAREEAFRTHAIQSMTGTSGRQRAQKESLASYRVAFPNECVWDAFASRVAPLLSRIGMNALESRSLASLRDTLLPKLMSGELPPRALEDQNASVGLSAQNRGNEHYGT